jgi:hypothetical protein
MFFCDFLDQRFPDCILDLSIRQGRYAASVLPAELIFLKLGADSECEITFLKGISQFSLDVSINEIRTNLVRLSAYLLLDRAETFCCV